MTSCRSSGPWEMASVLPPGSPSSPAVHVFSAAGAPRIPFPEYPALRSPGGGKKAKKMRAQLPLAASPEELVQGTAILSHPLRHTQAPQAALGEPPAGAQCTLRAVPLQVATKPRSLGGGTSSPAGGLPGWVPPPRARPSFWGCHTRPR